MKKLLLLAFVAVQALCHAQAKNESAALKIRYLPENEYNIRQNSVTNVKISYEGPEDVLQSLQEGGVQNPTIQKEVNESAMQVVTGKINSKNEFSVVLRILSSNNKVLADLIASKAVVHGHSTLNAFPVFDSISKTNLDKSLQKGFLDGLQAVLSQTKYPEQSIKVGESASLDTPFTIPIGPLVIEMQIHSTYKLTAIKGDIAHYDIEMVYTLTSNIDGYEIHAGGDGGGTIQFDTAKSFYKNYDLDTNMDMSLDMGELIVKLAMTQKTNASATVQEK
jgi:hypothetical protein